MGVQALSVAALSFVVVVLACPVLIWGLRTFRLTQPIRAELPADQQAKRGTPLMAGLILFAGIAILLSGTPTPRMLLLAVVFLAFGAIGFADDWKKAAFQDPGGISGRMKLVLQFTAAGGLLACMPGSFLMDTSIRLGGSWSLSMAPAVYFLVMLLFIVGSANAINFTDGMDGLLIVVALPTYLFFAVTAKHEEVQLFALVMAASLLGLLVYNIHPARAFMGDTGSLAIGGSLAFLAVIEQVEVLIPLLFFVCLAEQLSVMLQVWYFKRTRLRLFRMAPIHYHFRLKYGWSENRIVLTFGLVSWLCMLLALGYSRFLL
ncbi:phospho-N-acetylmuramoyl-pentapeptide-transferase [Paenibacillus sp. J31TS4]|uniref:phospho-N-acetylmuramoyl-pentapeptide- transferase n=1 Tax=Paenibacillus sp. J31TS4 TaxID=2807195 RepID=UPI001B287E2E|nr:phospho-N-acetylmuramoyl-pentapeptide-transferase [Paenibacillus sp. J31TS4]GIP38918.1 phospho-N-acetylmuramoyl-pentapeptide-transferase [Paenibacillus sp. J31TS4]